MKRTIRPHPFLFGLTLLSVLLTASVVVTAAPAGRPGGPVLTGAAMQSAKPGVISVTGTGFTPGGHVYVALYDEWGAALYETRWSSSKPTHYGRNGSVDPAAGFVLGGDLTEDFAGLCGATVLVRAFDQVTSTWSNWLDVDSTAADHAHYGQNGSADPAMGFVPGCTAAS